MRRAPEVLDKLSQVDDRALNGRLRNATDSNVEVTKVRSKLCHGGEP